ncbi:MAG: DUF1801 domain-containing protein [Burkholderiales bacterium]
MDRNRTAFAELLATIDPALRPICDALRDALIELHAGAVEIVWQRQRVASYGVGPKKLSHHYAFIAPLASHVKLGFYRGAFLNDPHGLLVGRGPRSRHVVLTDVESARSEALKHLLRQSISERLAARGT